MTWGTTNAVTSIEKCSLLEIRVKVVFFAIQLKICPPRPVTSASNDSIDNFIKFKSLLLIKLSSEQGSISALKNSSTKIYLH